jgi:iron(III) transport system permease protein
MHEFPGRRVFEWALVLPLAMPAYVMAYVYTDLLQFVGPVQTWLRETFGWRRADYWFPDVRSVGGAVAMFIFVLYPYVYLLARNAFLERAAACWRRRARWAGAVAQLLARLAAAGAAGARGGTALALMETLADYGTVAYFGVQTFTTGIYRAWFSLGDRVAAAQLAALLLGFVCWCCCSSISRGARALHNTTGRAAHAAGVRTGGRRLRCGLRGCAAAAVPRLPAAGRACCSTWPGPRATRSSERFLTCWRATASCWRC